MNNDQLKRWERYRFNTEKHFEVCVTLYRLVNT